MSRFVASSIVHAPAGPLSANQMARQQFDRMADRLGLDTTLRKAADMIGIGRVAEASRLRGWV